MQLFRFVAVDRHCMLTQLATLRFSRFLVFQGDVECPMTATQFLRTLVQSTTGVRDAEIDSHQMIRNR
ncbi:hypothetical protein CCR95_04565 [Thiocystis minor]|nr:hypothetical protein [Thiocystis minor]